MTLLLNITANCDDTYLVWMPTTEIPNCLGFAIYRKRNGGEPELLKNRVGFDSQNDANVIPQPSTIWPFQRLSWTDHGGNTGDTVAYQVVAMVGTKDSLHQSVNSEWSTSITLTPDCGNGLSAYFNRGIVLSQFMSRIMRERNWGPGDIKAHAGMLQDTLREFLGGDLREAMITLLNEASRDSKLEVYAALFEATDPELSSKLEFLGPRLHIVLGNGAVKNKGEDENQDLRKALTTAGVEVFDRMTAPTFLAHNKFMVICRNGKPVKVWTGSTNWQPTGICTQINNGILIENSDLAQDFFDAWERLRDAGNSHTADFKEKNSVELIPRKLGDGISGGARFTATVNHVDLDDLLSIIGEAQRSIFFEMYMPGADIFNAVKAKSNELYVQGVVNTFPADAANRMDTTLIDGKQEHTFGLDVVEPEGIDKPFAVWGEEVTRKQFQAIGFAIIHSKVLVLDAFTDNPIVVTGSHNFSNSASSSNDENFVVIRGSKELAKAYAVNCLAVYDHYRWRKYVYDCVRTGKKPWSHLDTSATWLKDYMNAPSHQTLLKFWFAGVGS